MEKVLLKIKDTVKDIFRFFVLWFRLICTSVLVFLFGYVFFFHIVKAVISIICPTFEFSQPYFLSDDILKCWSAFVSTFFTFYILKEKFIKFFSFVGVKS